MADSVSKKQFQRRLGKESINNSDKNTNSNKNINKSSSIPSSSSFLNNSTANNLFNYNEANSKNIKITSADILESASVSREDLKSRTTIQRCAKSKAKEAITSILLPHNITENQLDISNSNKTSKIDQINNPKQQQQQHQQINKKIKNQELETSVNKSINNQKSRSRSIKRRRSQSSTLNTELTPILNNSSNNSIKNSDNKISNLTHNLRSSRKSTNLEIVGNSIQDHNIATTSKKVIRKNSNKSTKSIPNKKPKLNSDINNNLNITRSTSQSTDSSTSRSYSSSSTSSTGSSASSSTNSRTSSQFFKLNNHKKTKTEAKKLLNTSRRTISASDISSISTSKELGNTCNIRSKETTGGCITRPTLRRSSQQQQGQAELQDLSAVATSLNNSKKQKNSFKTSKSSNKKSGTLISTSNINNMNVNNNNNNNYTTTTTVTTTTNTTTTTTSASQLSPFSSLFGNTNQGNTNVTSSTAGPYTFPISESESDDNTDFSRLTDILQARGLPSHIVNAFGNKVQQFLSRTMSSGLNSRSQQLIQSLQQNDESLKLTALTELCQLLVMGNEDTLAGFPIKQAVPLLLQCMTSESNNYDLMNHACRALTYMMESLPRSSSVIAEGIPIFLEKLQIIQCMDVAEQALTALEILSRRNSKQILHSNGISACLTFIDFFSITAQRNALQITANCCQNMIKEEFVHIQSSLNILAQRLTHSDKKSVESVCTIFSRLVENFQRDQIILKEIASHNVLTNMQQLLVVQSQLISSTIFVMVLHTMHLMCINCTELAVELLQNSIADTLKYLLTGPSITNTTNSSIKTVKFNNNNNNNKQSKALFQQNTDQHIELVSRPPQELYEIVSLISEILPKLPQTGIFQIDDALKKSSSSHQTNHIMWQWKDERDIWRPYTPIDSRLIEAAFLQEEDEVSLSTMGRTYVIDFNTMLQINEETGTARPVVRKIIGNSLSSPALITPSAAIIDKQENINHNEINDNNIEMTNELVQTKMEPTDTTSSSKKILDNCNNIKIDHRLEFLNKNGSVYADFVRSLFVILYEVYSSSAGPAIKHRCLRALLRMIYYTNSELLHDVLLNLTISSHIASILASQDLKIIVCALQICEILMEKLPNIFSIYFHREGVIHQIDRLIETYSLTPLSGFISSVTSSETRTIENKQEPTFNLNSDTENNNESIPSSTTNNHMINSQTFPNLFTPSASAMWPYNIATNVPSNFNGATSTTSLASMTTSLNTTNNNSYKLTPFGMDTIIGDTFSMNYINNSNDGNKINLTQPPMTVFSPIEQDQQQPSASTIAKAELKFVETLKRKVRTPKRPGRKSNKNEQDVSTTSSNTASNYDLNTNTQEETPSTSSTSKYVQNVISKLNTNRFNNSSLNTKQSAATTPTSSAQSNLMPLYPPVPTLSYPQISNTATASTTTVTNRANDFSIFGTQLWSHLRGASSSLLSRNHTATAVSTASNQSTNKSNTTTLSTNAKLAHNLSASAIPIFRGKKLLNTTISATNPTTSGLSSNLSNNHLIDHTAISFNKEKVRQWIYEQAKKFKEKYFSNTIDENIKSFPNNHGLNILQRLNKLVKKLEINLNNSNSLSTLKEISDIIYETDISSFEMINSGLITKLLGFLTVNGDQYSQSECLRQFLHVFANLPLFNEENNINFKQNHNNNLLTNLISKLHNCVNQLEQFAVRVHDVPNSIGYGKTAIKFFNTHQLKCSLQRHQDATGIRQWKGGTVKVDPLAIVSAIEKYLIMRGMNKSPQANDSEDSENSDDDIEEAMSAILGRSTEANGPRLELLINDHVLPSNITIYQAIKQYTLHTDTDNETDNESFVNNEIWSKVHTITYRLASIPSTNTSNKTTSTIAGNTTIEKRTTRTGLLSALSNSTSNNKSATTSSSSSSKRGSSNTASISSHSNLEAINNQQLISNTHFYNYLNNNWQKQLTINDLSIEAISLLRILHVINRNWHLLYAEFSKYGQIIQHFSHTLQSFMINSMEFVNNKLTAKANRQLQDPLVIMTGHLPKWLPELIKTCGFLFPFETRLMFFYVSSFDRDRAMQKLLDLNTEIGNGLNDGTNSNERIVPKIERKKKTIIRENDIIKQSESILNDFGKSKALLEIQYENEVGTGLGPTLEFYALVSLEIQKTDYELWRGDKIKISTATGSNHNCFFYFSPNGLFPAPLAKNAKQQYVNKIRNKFKFFGKFVAKAIMDFRILDIQLSIVFHKWLIDNNNLNDYDIKYVDSVLYRSMESLREYLDKYKLFVNKQKQLVTINYNNDNNNNELKLIENEINKLDNDVRNLDLDFTLPGYSNIELKKNGKDLLVNLYNLEEYLKLITQWTLVDGVQRQFESFKEGFNSIFPINSLNQFYPEELERLFCGSGYDIWDSKLLIECTRCDHGYTHDSKAVQFLFEILSSYNPDEQRLFLQFVTGSPRLPVGGLRSLTPQLTIVRKTIEGNDNPDNYLPSVMTCVNYLKLPDYSSVDILRDKLIKAVTEGQLSFNLS